MAERRDTLLDKIMIKHTIAIWAGDGGWWTFYGWESREECEKYMRWVNRNRFLTYERVSAWTAHGGKEPSRENPLYGKDVY